MRSPLSPRQLIKRGVRRNAPQAIGAPDGALSPPAANPFPIRRGVRRIRTKVKK